MPTIHVEHNPTPAKLAVMGVYDWPIWTKEISSFPWVYDQAETCYILSGEIIITPEGEKSIKCVKGDLIYFPKNFSCRWDILKPVKKHYRFSN